MANLKRQRTTLKFKLRKQTGLPLSLCNKLARHSVDRDPLFFADFDDPEKGVRVTARPSCECCGSGGFQIHTPKGKTITVEFGLGALDL